MATTTMGQTSLRNVWLANKGLFWGVLLAILAVIAVSYAVRQANQPISSISATTPGSEKFETGIVRPDFSTGFGGRTDFSNQYGIGILQDRPASTDGLFPYTTPSFDYDQADRPGETSRATTPPNED